jgi:hypothetical protein
MQLLFIYLLLIIISIFPGCATTTPTSTVAPITQIEALPAYQTQAELTAGADPYYSKRQKTVFGLDMSQAGILPILVYLQNKGTQSLTVRPENMSLELHDGQEVKTIDPDTAAGKLELKAGSYVAAGAFYGLIGVLATQKAHEDAKAKLQEEYQNKKLREVTLTKGESAQGFVYFYMPQGIQHATGAQLIVPFTSDRGRGGMVRLPLGGK